MIYNEHVRVSAHTTERVHLWLPLFPVLDDVESCPDFSSLLPVAMAPVNPETPMANLSVTVSSLDRYDSSITDEVFAPLEKQLTHG